MNAIIEHINSAGYAFVEFAAAMLIQSGLLILLLLLADFALRKRVRAVFRYWIWMLVLVKLVLPTSLSGPFSLGYWFGDEIASVDVSDSTSEAQPQAGEAPVPVLPHIIDLSKVRPPIYPPSVTPLPGETDLAPAESTALPSVPAVPITWQGVVFLLWLAVAAVMLLLLGQRAIFVRGLVAQAKNANRPMLDTLDQCRKSMKIKRAVTVKISPNATSPAVCELWRPVILIPHNMPAALGSADLRVVLLHELAHIKRGDLWVNLIQTLLQILYFYNPLLWLANAVIRRAREQAVDEVVLVAMGEKARRYPQTLVSVAKLAFERPALSLRLIGVVESKSTLTARIKHILNRPMPKSAKLGALGLLAIIVAAAILLPMAKENTGDSKIVVKEYRLKHPVSQREMGALVNKISHTLKRPLFETIKALAGKGRSKTYHVQGHSTTGKIVVFANGNQHTQAAKFLRKEYGDLLRPEKLYDMSSVANIDVFADNCRKIVKDVFTGQKFMFLTEEDINYIAEDLGDFVRTYTRGNVPKEMQLRILESLDMYLYSTFRSTTIYQQESTYLELDDRIKTLKLKLWQIIATEPLTEKERTTLAEQKQWIYDFADNYPNTTEMEKVSRMYRAGKVFNDILNGFSMQPMSEETFEELQKDIRGENNLSGIANEASCWSTRIAIEDYNQYRKTGWPFPFGVVTSLGGGSDRVDFNFKSEKPYLLKGVWLSDVAEVKGHDNAYDVASRKSRKAPNDCTTDEKLEEWLSRQNAGDFYYDLESESIVGCRGAKMAVLDVNNWIESDRIPTEKLRDIIHTKPIPRFSVSGFRSLDNSSLNHKDKPVIPIIAIETESGNVALIRPNNLRMHHPKSLYLKIRHRFEGWDDLWFDSFITGELRNPTKKSKTTQSSKLKTQNSNYTDTLPNGATVELVGVCEHPSEGKQWWKPDGDELLEAPYDEIGGNVYPDGDEKSFEFAIKLRNLPAEHVNTKVGCEESVGGTAGGGSSPEKNGEYLSDFRWLATTFPKKLKACTVKVGVAAGQWQPVAESNGKGFGSRGSELGGVSFTKAFEVEDGISITVADDILGRPCRVVAITNDGEVVKPVRSSGSSAGKARQTTAKFNNISLSDIKEFQFQTRPYEWVEFKNVSLRPGVQTNVQVEVEPPGGGRGGQEPPTNTIGDVPAITKIAQSAVQIDVVAVEVVGKPEMDAETTAVLKNILGDKTALDDPEMPSKKSALAAEVLLRKAVAATGAVEDASGGNKRVTEEEFKAVVETLVSRGYMKILMNSTLQLLSGKTAKIKSSNGSEAAEDSFEVTAHVLDDGYIDLQARAVLKEESTPADQNSPPLLSKRELSTTTRIRSGTSFIMGGIKKSVKRPVIRGKVEYFEEQTTEVLVILTATIIAPPSDPQKKPDVEVEGELASFAQECVRRIMQACDQEQPKQDYTNYITESSIYRIDSNDLTPEKKEQRIKSIIESIKERFDPNLGHNLAIAGFSDKMIVVDIYNKEKKPDVEVEVENDGEKGSQFTVTPANGVTIEQPTTIRVPEDYPTLLAAVDAAKAGDTIVISGGRYYRGEAVEGKGRSVVQGNVLDHQGEPVEGATVELQLFAGGDVDDQDKYSIRRVTTDANGLCVFEDITAGSAHIGRAFTAEDGSISGVPHGLMFDFEIEAGKSYDITLGGKGRPVVGRLVPASGNAGDIDWSKARAYFDLRAAPFSMGSWEYNAKIVKAMTKAEGDSFYRKSPVKINPDGTFRIDNVRAGLYMLRVKVLEEPKKEGFNLFRDVRIPLMRDGTTETPLNLGSLAVSHGDYKAPRHIDNHFLGSLTLDKDIPVILKAGNDEEPDVVSAKSIRFSKDGELLTAALGVEWKSIVADRWRARLTLLSGNGSYVAWDDVFFETFKIIGKYPQSFEEQLNFSLGRQPDLSAIPRFTITIQPVSEILTGNEQPGTGAEIGRAEAERVKAGEFEELSVKFGGIWMHWQDLQFTVRGDGSVEFSMNSGPNDKTRYRTAFKLSGEHLAELSGLLRKTNWLTAPGANEQPGYTDATRIDLSLTREDEVRKVWCHDRNPEPYLSLINFLKRIQRQEYLLYQMTIAGGIDRSSAFSDVYQQIRAEKGEPVSAHPHRILDFGRFAPASTDVITNPDDNHYETVAVAVKLLAHIKAEHLRQQITRLSTAERKEHHDIAAVIRTEYVRAAGVEALTELGGEQARRHIRDMAKNHQSWRRGVNEALVEGLLALDRDNCVELLKGMVSKTKKAGWGLIRLRPAALPAIVEILEVRDTRYMGQIYLIRQYIDRWQEVTKPIDPRVIEAVQKNLDYRLGRGPGWTQYHKEFLQLAGAPELPSKDARQIAEEFLAAVKTNDQMKIGAIARTGGGSWPQRLAKLKSLPGLQQLKVTEVYADKDGNIGMAVAFDTSREKGARVSIYLNFLSGSVWRVVNIAVERPEIGDRMTRRFLESHPNANPVPPRPAVPGVKVDEQIDVENDGEKGSQFTVTPANGVQISARELIAKIIESEKKIKDIRLQMTCTIGALDRTFYEYDWGYEDTKEFLSGTTNTKDSRTGAYRSVKVIRAFDGKREWLFRNDPKSSRPSGGITEPNPNFSFSGGIMTFNTLLGFDAKELSRLSLGQAIAQAESVSVKEQVEFIDGRPCYVIEAINLETDPSVHWAYDVRAWIDYQRDYRPLKFEKYRSIPGKNRFKVVSRRVDNIKLEQIDGIWLPIEGTRTTFSTNDIHPPKGMTAARFGALPSEQRLQLGVFKLTPMVPTRKLEVDVESIRLNKGISPEAFTIAFPKGCEVYDEFAGNRYIVGEQSEKDAALSDAELIEQTKKLSVSELIDVLRSKSLGLSKRRWFAVIHRLVEIGPPAVAQLVAEIRKTEKPQTQSKLALTLRAIGDLNAVAGLIDALERAGFSSDYGLGEPKTELGRFYKTYQMDPAKKGLGLGRPVREITIALERLTGHSEGHDHFHAYDSAGNRLGSYTITPEIRDRQRQHRRQVAQKWRTWWQTNKDKIKPPEMPPTPPAEPKPPKPKGHEGMVLAAPEGAELTLAIVPNIGDSARQPSLTKEQYQKYLDYLAENGPFAGSVRGDSFQWLPIKGDTKNYKGLPLSAYKERTYILLCARAQYVMIPEVEGKRIWGLEAVEVTRDMQGRDAISVRFDEKGAELLAKLTKANIDNHLALAVDGWVRLASVIQAPLKEAAFITGDFPAGEVRTLVEDLKKGMPVVDQQAIRVMQQIAEAAEKLNKDDLAKMGPRQVVENLLVAGLAGDSEKLAWFIRGESVAAKAITIDDFAQMADGHKIKVLEVHADSSDAVAVTSNIKGKSGDQEGQLIFYLSKQTGAWLIHDADVGDSEKAHENVDEFLITHPDVQVEGEGKGLADNSKVIEQAIQRSYEVSGTVFDPVPDSWWDDLFTKLEAVESEGEGRQILENVENLPGHPAAGVVVTLRGDSLTKETVTDAEGKFKFSGLPEGAYSLSCEKTVVSTRTGQKRLAVAKGDAQFNSRFPISSRKADLRLRDDYVTVKGRITDAQGRPVAGAKVTAILVVNNVAYQQYLANHDPPTWFAVSKNDGSYELQGIDPANFYHLAGYLQGGKALREYVDIDVEANGFVQDKNNIPKVPLVSEDVLYQARRLLKIFSQMSQRAGGPEYQEMDRLTFPSGSGNTITGIDIVLEQAGTAVPVEVEPSKSPPAGDLPNNPEEPQRNTDEVKYEGRTVEQWISQFDSESYDDRREAIEALARIGRPAVPTMIEQMKKGGMRASCASGVLGKMGPEAEDAVPWLIEAALDKDLRFGDGRQSTTAYRGTVLHCLSNMTWARDRVIPVLQRVAEDGEEEAGVRRQVILALRDVGKGAMPILQKLTEAEERSVRDAAHGALGQLLEKGEGLSKDDYYTSLIEKDPFGPSVLQYLGNAKGIVNYGRPHPLTQRIKQLYRKRLAEEPDAELAWRLASIIQNGLKNTELMWAAPTDGSRRRSPREDPTENYATLAEVLQLGFDHAESGSQLQRQFGTSLAKLRLLQGDWDGMNAMLKELGQKPIPKESRQWLPAPPVDWEEDLRSQWKIADESMRSGNCSLEFKVEKDGKGLKGVHFLVKRAPESTNVINTGISVDTLFFEPYPLKGFSSFGYKATDRPMTRYAVSDESGIVRFEKLPNIPIKIEVLVPTPNFPEAVSNWDLWMEVEPGKYKIAKKYGAGAINTQEPPAVAELKEGQTVHYPKLVVRSAFGLNVRDWDRVDKENFTLTWQGLDPSIQVQDIEYELQMHLSAPGSPHNQATHAPVVRSAKQLTKNNQWPISAQGVGNLHLEPGNIYMFEVRAIDESGTVVARWPRTRVWVPWGYRRSDPPFTGHDTYANSPVHHGLWHRGSFGYGDGRKETLREKVTRVQRDYPDAFEYEYACVGKAWLDWHDDRQDARRQLEKLVKELPEGNVARGTALWMIQQIDQNKEPPKRLNFVPDRETSRSKTPPPSM